MNKIKPNIIVIIVVAVILVGIFAWYFMNNHNNKPTTQNNEPTVQNSTPTSSANATGTQSAKIQNTASKNVGQNQPKGTMYFTLADEESVYMGEVTGVTAVKIVIDKVQTYNQAYGWITASQTPQTFDLLQLKSASETVLLAKALVPAEKYQLAQNTYNEFRLHIAKVTVTASGTTKEAILPSNYIDIKTTDLLVYTNNNVAAQFNIMAGRSLHQTDKGEFVFTPVIEFNSRINATVQIGQNNATTVSFGQTNAPVDAGMDANGQMKTDFVISPTAKLSINGGVIQVNNQ